VSLQDTVETTYRCNLLDRKEMISWLTDIAVVVRVIALAVAAIAGALIQRDVGVLPDAAPPVPLNVSSSRLLADKAECPPPP